MLKKGTPQKQEVAQEEAFKELKRTFITILVLAMFNYNRKTMLEINASDQASSGILLQYKDKGVLYLIAYFLLKHSLTKCNYKIYDKELLAIIKCLQEWRLEL